MARNVDLEMLREIFKDNRVHLALGLVQQVETLTDFSKVKALVKVLPEEYEVVAEVTWDAVGPNAGDFQEPQKDDLVMIGQTDDGGCYILRRLSSKVDRLPQWAKGGHRVIQSLAGKKLYLGGPAGVFLGAGGAGWAAASPAEPLVLGNVLAECLNAIFDKLNELVDQLRTGPLVICDTPGNPGTTYPALATALQTFQTELTSLKNEYVTAAETNILSAKAFTER